MRPRHDEFAEQLAGRDGEEVRLHVVRLHLAVGEDRTDLGAARLRAATLPAYRLL